MPEVQAPSNATPAPEPLTIAQTAEDHAFQRRAALELAIRGPYLSDKDVVARAQVYYDFLKGA